MTPPPAVTAPTVVIEYPDPRVMVKMFCVRVVPLPWSTGLPCTKKVKAPWAGGVGWGCCGGGGCGGGFCTEEFGGIVVVEAAVEGIAWAEAALAEVTEAVVAEAEISGVAAAGVKIASAEIVWVIAWAGLAGKVLATELSVWAGPALPAVAVVLALPSRYLLQPRLLGAFGFV